MKFKIYLSKLIILFVAISLIPLTTYSNNTKNVLELKISIKLQNAKLTTIFSKLKKENDINFSYGQQVIEDYSKYTVDYKEIKLINLLNDLASKGNFKYQIVNDDILIIKNNAQQNKIAGKIKDANGLTIPGATISEKGTTNATISNAEGAFSLALSKTNSTLVVSFTGYKTKEINLKGETNITISLIEDVNELEDVLIVGYGKQKRRDITGAITSASGRDISEVPTTNAFQALKGKIAGVDIYNSGNEPGSGVTVAIRGQRSIGAENSPLVVLDGIPIIGGLNEISPNDISSIEVLKDASATAIYGSRASNGVILVTTKRGVTGKTSVNFSTYYGQTSVINHLDLMNGEEFANLRREAERTVNSNGAYPEDKDIFDNIALQSLAEGKETDWQKLIYGNGSKQNHQLGITGGNENTQFNTSLNYFNEQGIVENSKFERVSLRVNLDHKINERFKFGVSSFISRTKQNITQIDLFDNVLRLNPLGTAYDENGEVLFRPTNDESQRVNPLSDLENSLNDTFKTRVFASLFAEYKLFNNLSYRLNVGPDLQFNKKGFFYGSNTTNNQGGASTAGINNEDVTSLVIENVLNYTPNLGDKNSLATTLVQSYQNQIENSNYTNVKNLPYDSQFYNNLGSAGEVTSIGSNYEKWRLLSYTARFNYQFDQRYLLTLTGRADGSSRFSEGSKWGYFPSAALGWRLSKEPFFNVSKNIISDLKFRVSYGETGNTAINPYQTFSTLSKSYYAFGNTAAPGFKPGTISNPELKWETTRQTNIGLDFEFWKQKISGSVNYYKADTDDLLLPRSLPTSSGFTTVLENIGSTRNQGLEINMSIKNFIPSKDFNWEVDFTFSTNKNKITKLYGDGKDDVGNLWFIGQPINVFYDYRKTGIWQTDEAETAATYGFQPGQIKVEDINKDGAIDANDKVVLGAPTPKWIGGMTQRISYKGFLLSVLMQTRQNNLVSSEFYGNNNRLAGRYNNIDVNYWTPENPTNDNPRPNVNQESVYLGSTLTYKDVSYVRVRNVMLSYSVPETLLNKIHLTGLTFNLTAENPFTITNYKGFDPEFESNGERALYPSTKTIALGLNINF